LASFASTDGGVVSPSTAILRSIGRAFRDDANGARGTPCFGCKASAGYPSMRQAMTTARLG
jgi:hypothetical protein